MRTEEFWVMDERDEWLVDDLELGLGTEPARVLAYLLRRATDDRIDDPRAGGIDVRLGTGFGRQPVTDALSILSERNLVTESTLESRQGRPPKAWAADGSLETTVTSAYGRRADDLVSASSVEPDRSATAGEPLRVGINWRPNGLHVPFYAALEMDAYETAGVDVEFTHYRGSKRALEAAVDGEVDVSLVGAATLTRDREDGAAVEPLAVMYQRAMTILYTTRSAFGEPLTGSEQLRGRRIGMSPNTETGLLAEVFLSQAGVADDVEVVETDGEELETLRSGRADVVAGSFSDPWKLEADHTVDTLTPSEQFPIYGPALAVDPSVRAADRLRAFLAGTISGWRAGRADPTPAAERIADSGDDDPDEIERTFRQALDSFASSKAMREDGWGAHREDDWERLRIALARTGRLEPA